MNPAEIKTEQKSLRNLIFRQKENPEISNTDFNPKYKRVLSLISQFLFSERWLVVLVLNFVGTVLLLTFSILTQQFAFFHTYHFCQES